MTAFFGLLVFLAIGGTLIVAGAMIAIPSTREKAIAKFPITGILTKKKWAPYAAVAIGLSSISGGISNFNASVSGFPDAATYEAAKKEGISSYGEYQSFLAEKADKEALAHAAEVRAVARSERYDIDTSGELPVILIKPTSFKYFVEDEQVESECARILKAAGPAIENGYAKNVSSKDVEVSFKDLDIDDAGLLFALVIIKRGYYKDKDALISDYQKNPSENIWQNAGLIADCKRITLKSHADENAHRKELAAQEDARKRQEESHDNTLREMNAICETWASAMKECATAGDITACMNIKYQGGGNRDICNIDGTSVLNNFSNK